MEPIFLTVLRNKNISRFEFRSAAYKLGCLLAAETVKLLEKSSIKVQTPLGEAAGVKFKNNIVLVPILRSGMALLEPFLSFYVDARIGFVGIRRDEKTAIPNLYYSNIPKISKEDDIIVLDPMIATGGSGEAALRILLKTGMREEKIVFAAVIASQEGFDYLKTKFPKIKMLVSQVDPGLNDAKFIVPGLGDFGDRYFGTE